MKKTNKQLHQEIAELKEQKQNDLLLIKQLKSDNSNLQRIANNHRLNYNYKKNKFEDLTKDTYKNYNNIQSKISLLYELSTHRQKNEVCEIINRNIDIYIEKLDIFLDVNELRF